MTAKVRDWAPAPTATEWSGLGGYQNNNADGRKKPTRYEVGTHWECFINLGPDQ